MRNITIILLFPLLLLGCDLLKNNSGIPINENIWVNGYIASWQHNPETDLINTGILTTDDIDWDAMTHLTYFSLRIGADGLPFESLDPQFRYNFNSDRLEAIVPAAHNHNTKILFSVGGAGNYENFSSAIRDTNRTQFISTVKNILNTYGFDGINLNMVPIEESDLDNYSAFVQELYSEFDSLKTNNNERPLLTTAALKTNNIIDLYVDLQDYFDQINFLTYDMAQPWRGWKAWHNSALYNESYILENTSERYPSVDQKISEAIDGGIKRGKIGLGINFYGYVWDTVNLLEKWDTWPTQNMSILSTYSYSELSQIYNLENASWDDEAKVPYINLSDPKAFITFENKQSVQEKVYYAKKKRIGGVMIWELGGAFIPDSISDINNPLLRAIKKEAFPPDRIN